MALVAYGSSDESDIGSDNEESTPVIQLPRKAVNSTAVVVTEQNEDNNEDSELPTPSEKERELAEIAKREKPQQKIPHLSELVVKEKGKVKISIPSFADFDEEEKTSKSALKKAPAASGGRSALFSVLPSPKTSSGLEAPAPKSQTQTKPIEKKASVPLVPRSLLKPKEETKAEKDEDAGPVSFFTLDEPEEPSFQSDALSTGVGNLAAGAVQYAESSQWVTNESYNLATCSADFVPQPQYSEQEDGNLDLDEEAVQFLQGKKRKLPKEIEERLIDVRAEKLSYDPNMSHLKQVSEERASSTDKGPAYNPLQKRKHQITYLAAQAKARELELKNQWAQNRMSRKQTQAKYGF